jgi:hypothetical protein
MPVTVEKRPHEPIIGVTFSGYITTHDIYQAFDRSEELARSIPGRVYRVIDTSAATTRFLDIVMLLAEAAYPGRPGSTADPRWIDVLVSTPEAALLVALPLGQHPYDLNLPVFSAPEAALAHLRAVMAHEL